VRRKNIMLPKVVPSPDIDIMRAMRTHQLELRDYWDSLKPPPVPPQVPMPKDPRAAAALLAAQAAGPYLGRAAPVTKVVGGVSTGQEVVGPVATRVSVASFGNPSPSPICRGHG